MLYKFYWVSFILFPLFSQAATGATGCHDQFRHVAIANTIGQVVEVPASMHKISLNPELLGPEKGGWRPPVFALWGIERAGENSDNQEQVKPYTVIQDFAKRSSDAVEVYHFNADVILKVDYNTEEFGLFRNGKVLTYSKGKYIITKFFFEFEDFSSLDALKIVVKWMVEKCNFYSSQQQLAKRIRFKNKKSLNFHKKHFEEFNVDSGEEYIDLLNTALRPDQENERISMVVEPLFLDGYDFRAKFLNIDFSAQVTVVYELKVHESEKLNPLNLVTGYVFSNNDNLLNIFLSGIGLSKPRVQSLISSNFDFKSLL